MAFDEKKNKGEWAGVAKWVVLGVVIITTLFLFRGEISRILERAENIEISSSGVKIKTAQTPLGKVEVSNVTIKPSKALVVEGIRGDTYVSRQYKFQISWPGGGGWSASDTMGKSLLQQYGLPPTVDIPLVILKNEMVGNFRPNINVVVESVGSMSISDYINMSVQILQQQGWEMLTRDIDEATQGGFISFYNTTFGYRLYQFQRIAVTNGRAYVITASQLPPEDALSQHLRQGLLTILNSFRIIM